MQSKAFEKSVNTAPTTKLSSNFLHSSSFIVPNNDLLEAVTKNIFKIRLKKEIFASTNILEDF